MAVLEDKMSEYIALRKYDEFTKSMYKHDITIKF